MVETTLCSVYNKCSLIKKMEAIKIMCKLAKVILYERRQRKGPTSFGAQNLTQG